MSKVLVTGANSFLAGNVIKELLKRGYYVKGMMRRTARILIRHDNLEIFYGNITDEIDVIDAAKGCKTIIHVAALTDQSVAGHSKYAAVNVGGTGNIIKAAGVHNIDKIIYVSTANAFGYGTKDGPGNEGLAVKYPFTDSGYAKSKIMAQNLILNAFKNSGIRVTVVNPTFMIGPNDLKVSSNRIILRALNKKIIFIPPGGKNFIHVGDAAAGTCNAIDRGKNGECYILANENLTYREFYIKMAKVTGRKPLLVTIPRPLLRLGGIAGSFLRAAGINTAISPVNMKIIGIGNYYDPTKAVNELELPQTPVEKAIEETITWFGG